MKTLKILNRVLSILNIIIGSILTLTFGIKIGLLFWFSVMLGGIEGIIFDNLKGGEKDE